MPSFREATQRLTEFDWGTTPLGPLDDWPARLRGQVELVMAANQPMYIAVGPDLIFIHNDAYRSVIRGMSDDVIGQPMREVFADIWPEIEGMFTRVMEGESEVFQNLRISTPWRADRPEGRFSFGLVPIGNEAGSVHGFVASLFETTELVAAEAELRANQARQSFLLRLSDTMRPLANPIDVQGVAARLLGTQLNVDRCYYAEFDWDNDVLHISTEYTRAPSFSVVGAHPISAFKDMLQFSHQGTPLVCNNISTHAVFSSEAEAYRQRETDGFILMPLVKKGRMEACVVVSMATPRDWTADDVELVREVGDRTWDASLRARSEEALRYSEERFSQFAQASTDAIWIRTSPDLQMEFVSPAIQTIYGIDPTVLLGDVKHWAARIVPEDRARTMEAVERVKSGEQVTHEFRIVRPDGTFRWIRNTDFPLFDEDGKVERVAGIATDITESRQAIEHQGVLLAELQHRVRNIMGMIRSLANRTAGSASSVENYRELLEGRLLALARVQALLTRQVNVGAPLHVILEAELSAQGHAGQYELNGPQIDLSPKAVEVLTLAFHELATNALKYGALSVESGRISVDWALFEKGGHPWLSIDWVESGGPRHEEPPTRVGFGSQLIKGRIPYELHGTGDINIRPGGAECHLEFPLEGAESILETDAPAPTTVYGGSLDMSSAADLSGTTIVVVEDDYFMASDLAAALASAGADILGPYPSEAATLQLLETQRPTAAVVDLNLGGGGPRFEVARSLRSHGVPFVFLTGYDPEVIPDDLTEAPRLQKPVPLREVIEAVGELLQ